MLRGAGWLIVMMVLVAPACGSESLGGNAHDAGADVAPQDVAPIPYCGDGVVEADHRYYLDEQCDDGNRTDGDGCSSLCTLEPGWSCPRHGGACTHSCGDGLYEPPEACDDGNTTDGDGCSADCMKVDPGYTCPVLGRLCVPLCGDGVLIPPEACDDGNTMDGDGCSSVCRLEPDPGCPAGTCVPVCGNGVLEADEQCDCGDGTVPPGPGCAGPNADGVYGGCASACRLGPYCGDGNVDPGEQCDNGAFYNTVIYASPTDFGCAPNCQFPGYCGDGLVQPTAGESCDHGSDNGVDGMCTSTCNLITD